MELSTKRLFSPSSMTGSWSKSETPQGTIAWQVGGLLMLGSLVGAAITPRILNRFDPRLLTAILRPILGIMLLIMAVAQVW